MSLPPGSSLGPYEVVGLVGIGGMGEVYRARDTRLQRTVAIKVIAQQFARDEQRMGRFQREAQVLASLNHPNIASIYGLEEGGDRRALVMELVEGPTLAERLMQGAIPIEEALPIAIQITEALEYAHERGIIHRDLKPANIKLTQDAKVKLLDFGLAKALQVDARSSDVSDSPTLSLEASEAGIILGTAAYMSPEQAKGKTVDRRTDIWSFGVVLFEMLTGRQMFTGETTTEILAAVIRAEPDWAILPAALPPHIRELLKRCLVKDDKRRLRDIGDARLELDTPADAATGAESLPNRSFWRFLPWAIAIVATGIMVWTFLQHRDSNTASTEVMHLDLDYPPGTEPIAATVGDMAISPDGHVVAMIGSRDGVKRLYIRRLDRPEAMEVSEVISGSGISFSPDSANVTFLPNSSSLTRLSLADRRQIVVASGIDLTGGAAWGSEQIVYNRGGALWVGSAQGGDSKQLTALNASRQEVLHRDPELLPGGRTVLFSSLTVQTGTERIEAVSLDGKRRWVVVEHAMKPIWSPTGHLLFVRDGAVWAVPLEPKDATVRGPAVTVIPLGVVSTTNYGGLAFQLSSTGTLVFVPADFYSDRVISVARDGSERALNLPPNRYGNPRISPDGRRLLIDSAYNEIETLDLVRGTRARLAAAAIGTSFSAWSADSKVVIYRRLNVPFWVAADGSGKTALLPGGQVNDFPSAPGPDPDSIIAVRVQSETSGDIFLLSISGRFPPKPLIMTPAYEGGAQLSPDRHWLLYQSNESGQPEIYVRRYPTLDREWQVSEGGGVQARWSHTGREIYFRSSRHMMSVALDASAAEPKFGKPKFLFTDEYGFGQAITIPNYDVTTDGRFIMLRGRTQGGSLRVVINWTEDLKKILAAGGVH
jgi:serine/threonine protein kinase